jgi:multidrug transporter EmrE-like cation transporter
MLKPILFCFLYALFNVTGAAFIKWKLKSIQLNTFNDWIRFVLNLQVMAAFLLIFLSALILFKALSSGDFSFIIPVSAGINFILTVIAGYFIFKDQLSFQSFIGMAMIISGIILLSLKNVQNVQ